MKHERPVPDEPYETRLRQVRDEPRARIEPWSFRLNRAIKSVCGGGHVHLGFAARPERLGESAFERRERGCNRGN
jgi:hypothetical protein